jgi:ribosome-binding ATPase
MSLKIGIVGLPNVGKSTLFKALTKKEVLIENYPFATIDPNVGVVQVPDSRLNQLTKLSNSAKTIPTVIEFVDIAGLVKDAHKGEGLGNQFLSNIREVDTILHLIRAFEDTNIHHVDGSINPARDEDTIRLELIMADMETIAKRIQAVEPKTKTGDKEMVQQLEVFSKARQGLENENWLASEKWTEEEMKILKQANLLTMKPVIHLANIHESSGLPDNMDLAFDVKQELEMSALSKEEKQELGIKETGLDKLIVLAYSTLDLITFLTTGEQETRAWTVPAGSTAPQAAGVIHTDFEQGFIKAEVIQWQELLDSGSWNTARDKGLIRTEGKEYVVKDGDVVFFKV